jgi:hypothetical protein
VKSLVIVLIVAPLVLLKSHAYSSYAAPFGVTLPAMQDEGSVEPQRHGVSCSVAAHFDEKIVPRTSRQTDRSVIGAVSGANTVLHVLPSASVPEKSVALAVSASQVVAPCVGSKQPFAAAHCEHVLPGGEVDLSCAAKQVCVVAFGFVGSQAPVLAEEQVPAVAPVAIVHVSFDGQVPQVTVPPQPSGAVPHVLVPQACAAVIGAHTQVVPLQVVPAWHVPQLIVPPQPFGAVPQVWPAGQLV